MTPTRISHVQLQYSHTIGRGEQFGPGFTYPVHMARGEDDLMYVLCRSPEYRPEGTRIAVCTVDEEYVNAFARGVPQQGPHEYNFDDGSLVWPVTVAIASNGNVYVSDEWMHRISIFSGDGEYLGKWEERLGSGDGELNRPAGLAIDKDDNVFVVDSMNHRVQKFTPDGKFLSTFGSFRRRGRRVPHALGNRHRQAGQHLYRRLAERPHPEVYGRRSVPDEVRFFRLG